MPSAQPEVLTVQPFTRASGRVRLPGSKSLSNRALLLASLAEGTTTLHGLLDADDTRVMLDALRALGVQVTPTPAGAVAVTGTGGRFPVRTAALHLGNAGTAFRSLTAALALMDGHYTIDGVARMRERPIGDLVDALRAVGARIEYGGRAGYPPLAIAPFGGLASALVSIGGDVSSQFVSGLLMAAPLVAPAEGLQIEVPGTLISQPYVAMTLATMQAFGVAVAQQGQAFRVPRAHYVAPGDMAVEGDASAASYFLALGAIGGGPVRVEGVGRASVQGDVRFAEALAAMGASVTLGDDCIEASAPAGPLRPIDGDFNHIPDAAMTLAVLACFARAPSTLRNIGSWRVKETDRIAAMAAELSKVGATVDTGDDWIRITPPTHWREATIDTYDDHRMAMCFSLIAAAGVPVHIRDPGCVAKTVPDYFERFGRLLQRAAP